METFPKDLWIMSQVLTTSSFLFPLRMPFGETCSTMKGSSTVMSMADLSVDATMVGAKMRAAGFLGVSGLSL